MCEPEGVQEDITHGVPSLVSRLVGPSKDFIFLHFCNSLVTVAKCFLMLEFYIKMQQEGASWCRHTQNLNIKNCFKRNKYIFRGK